SRSCRTAPVRAAEPTRTARSSRSRRSSPHRLPVTTPLSPGRPTIALDAMGSDHAPVPEVAGAIAAAREYGVNLLLVGIESRLQQALAAYKGADRQNIRVVPASEVITME